MSSILNILLGIVFIFHQISSGNSKEFYQLNINERGTLFNQTIEIDDVHKTIVYKVPSHNEIKKTVVFVDYQNGHFVTKINEREACFIKAFPRADEQSIGQTRQNLKLIQRMKNSAGNATIPVKTVTTIMKLIREIPRKELSLKVLNFCGDYSAYEVEEETIPRKKGKSIMKRASNQAVQTYRMRFRSSSVINKDAQKILPNGYLACDQVKDHTAALVDCYNRGKTPMVGCGLHPITCRYRANCMIPKIGAKNVPATNAMGLRDMKGTTVKFIWVDIECVEEHKFTEAWCCDVIPCD